MAIIDHFWFDYQTPLGRPVESPEGDSLTTVPIGFGAPGTFFDYTPPSSADDEHAEQAAKSYTRAGSGRCGASGQTSSSRRAQGEDGFVEDAWIGHELTVGGVTMKVDRHDGALRDDHAAAGRPPERPGDPARRWPTIIAC